MEGLTTAPVLRDLSQRVGVELPITEGVCRVLGAGQGIRGLLVGGSWVGSRPKSDLR